MKHSIIIIVARCGTSSWLSLELGVCFGLGFLFLIRLQGLRVALNPTERKFQCDETSTLNSCTAVAHGLILSDSP